MKSINSNLRLFNVKLEGKSIYPYGSERQRIEDKYSHLLREELNLGSLVSYVGNKNVPILRLYRYKEAFAFSLVNDFIERFDLNNGDYMLDPFSGMGTTLFVSMLKGISSVGVEKLPIAHFISKTIPLFSFLKQDELKKIFDEVKRKVHQSEPAEIAMDVAIMKVAFHDEILQKLRKWKSAIETLEYPYRDIFLLIFFSILEECSYTSKDGQFLRLCKNKKVSDPSTALLRKVNEAETDIRKIKTLFPEYKPDKKLIPKVYYGDTRNLTALNFEKKPTAIITSPPYPNRYDYTRTYSLELCFHFVKNFDELKNIRFGILRSHIESKIQKGETPPHPVIEEVVKALSKKSLNNPKIPSMLITYFVDMKKVIEEWNKILTEGAKVAMVVDNVRFEGELVPVDLVLSEIAEEAGFKTEEIIVSRYKGNSSQQMKRYGRVPVRESVLIWRK